MILEQPGSFIYVKNHISLMFICSTRHLSDLAYINKVTFNFFLMSFVFAFDLVPFHFVTIACLFMLYFGCNATIKEEAC